MKLARLALGALASVCSGFVAAWIANGRRSGGNSSWNLVARAFHPESLPALGEVPGLVSPDLRGLLVPAHPARCDVETARWKRASGHPAPEQRLVFLGSGGKISRNRISFVETKPSRCRNSFLIGR